MPAPGGDPSFWMIVTSPDNFARTEQRGFTLQGVKTRHRKKAEAMKAGDRFVYYLTGIGGFAASGTVTGTSFEDHEPIWQSKPGEDYPWRFPMTPDVVLGPARAVLAESLVDELEFVRKWPREHWRLAFQGNVHVLPAPDFVVIEEAMRSAAEK